jgi:hypothetical protein
MAVALQTYDNFASGARKAVLAAYSDADVTVIAPIKKWQVIAVERSEIDQPFEL